MMVDTLGLCVHDADPARLRDKFMKIDGDDGAQWSKGSLVTAAGKQALKVRAVKSKREYRMETSPAFLRQGHNIISSGDVPMLAFAAIQEANRDLKFGFSLKHAAEFVRGRGMDVTRVDTPVLLAKPAGLQTSAVINGLALAGLLAGNNTSVYVNESVYFDQHSQLAALKLYDKAAEVASRTRLNIPVTQNTSRLMLLAHETIRLEAVYRQKWLKRRFSEGGPLIPARLAIDAMTSSQRSSIEILLSGDSKPSGKAVLTASFDAMVLVPG